MHLSRIQVVWDDPGLALLLKPEMPKAPIFGFVRRAGFARVCQEKSDRSRQLKGTDRGNCSFAT